MKIVEEEVQVKKLNLPIFEPARPAQRGPARERKGEEEFKKDKKIATLKH